MDGSNFTEHETRGAIQIITTTANMTIANQVELNSWCLTQEGERAVLEMSVNKSGENATSGSARQKLAMRAKRDKAYGYLLRLITVTFWHAAVSHDPKITLKRLLDVQRSLQYAETRDLWRVAWQSMVRIVVRFLSKFGLSGFQFRVRV